LNLQGVNGREKTDRELELQAEGLSAIGKELTALGMRAAIHFHRDEMANDAREYRHIMDHVTDPSIGACFDVGWAACEGFAWDRFLDAYGGRVFDVHIRNYDDGRFTQSVEEGQIPYPELIRRLSAIGYSGWIVIELAYHDNVPLTRSFAENMNRSVWYLKGIASVV